MPERPKRPAKKTVVLHIRVEEELALRLEELAIQDQRKLSPFCAIILRSYVEQQDKEE